MEPMLNCKPCSPQERHREVFIEPLSLRDAANKLLSYNLATVML